jgi:hypothetical protein
MELSFDEYWEKIINKVFHSKEELSANDLLFYRLTCIRGEIMVDGIESYFERRFDEFKNDMNLLNEIGFKDIAEILYIIKRKMFGENELNEEIVNEIVEKLLDEDPNYMEIQNEINKSYLEIIEKIDRLDKYRMEYGIKNKLFTKY